MKSLEVFIGFVIVSFLSCNTNDKSGITERVTSITKLIDTSNISTFDNLLISTRGKKKDSETYLVVSFTFFDNNADELVLLPHNSERSLSYLVEQGYIERIYKLAERTGAEKENALKIYLERSKKIMSLFDLLKIPEVYNKPYLGDFTVFRINETHDLIYLHDINRIEADFWIDFFSKNQAFQGNWYLLSR